MSQIFNRIKNILSSYGQEGRADTTWADELINSDDDELRRLIEELNAGPGKSQNVPLHVTQAAEILGIDPAASAEVVRLAYRNALQKWHPDKFASASAAEHQKATEKTQEIIAAYVILKQFKQTR